jgi:hypothetical protein
VQLPAASPPRGVGERANGAEQQPPSAARSAPSVPAGAAHLPDRPRR